MQESLRRLVLFYRVSSWQTSRHFERRTGCRLWTTRTSSKTFTHSHSSSSVVGDCRTKHWIEDVSKTCVLSSRRMDESSVKFTKVVCSWTSVICHRRYLRFLIQLIIRKEKGSPSGKTLLPSPITTSKRRAVLPSADSLFSLLFSLWKLHILANLDALKMLLFAQGHLKSR